MTHGGREQMTQFPFRHQHVTIVLGMHRSGTSLCAHLLHALGVDMADEAAPSPNNERGHWERPRINDLNDEVFAHFGRSWNDPSHVLALPEDWLDDQWLDRIRMQMTALLAHGLGRTASYGFKDPRVARLLPLWRQAFAAAGAVPKYIFCIRDPAQVARSVSARDRIAVGQAEYRWLLYNAEAICSLGDAEICLVPYEHWFARPAETMARIAAFIGKPVPGPSIVAGIVDPALRHDGMADLSARPLARRLHGMILHGVLRQGAGQFFSPDLLAFCEMVADFGQQVQPLLVEREILRASVQDQNRVLGDLNRLISDLRQTATVS
jgi:hypothetical protein